ncbi:secreted protein [Leptodontidium sp. MPI-SDFR-AT-0119]|nr:secreted protein [Leptodontidium sp. MPI-SDFR-AT-0119]
MSSILFTSALLAGVAQAYTQVNVASPFMTKNIDPIVFPGQYDKSHLHSFFGSDAVTINTKTSAELQAGCTNAENPNDLSVYWVPTPLYTTDGGKTYKPIPLSRFSAYYNLGETEAEVAIPQNLQMVAGVSSATTEADMDANAQSSWACESENISLDANGFPSSTCSTHLQQLLYFPQCVNTATLETGYKTKRGGACPTGMKSMPQLRFSIRWDVRKALPNGWSGAAPFKLASGPAWSSHGDFINGWTEEAATNMLATTKEKQKFSAVDGALGTYNSGPTCTATDADPSNGTSDYAESVAAMSKRDVEDWGWSTKSRFVRA